MSLTYLATPYTKYAKGIEWAFIDAATLAGRLLRCGVPIYCPIAHCHPLSLYAQIDPLAHSVWLPFNETMLAKADVLAVAHMPGWDQSYGVAQEVKFFEDHGKPIFDLDPVDLRMVRRGRALTLPELAAVRVLPVTI